MSREDKGTTKPGYLNRNGQITIRDTGQPGTDFGVRKFQLACLYRGYNYGANSGDIWERKCPQCQGGAGGLPLEIPTTVKLKTFFATWPRDETDEELLGALKTLCDSARMKKA